MSDTRKIPEHIYWRLLDWYTPAEAEKWWTTEQKLMDGKRACDLPDSESLRVLDMLDSGAYI